ncbi:polysaccharide pyruvyl transferase family protein [Sedimentibacter hydroxybenzoicus DSM 7310]|uniref:Polysaccharide pyruvyl transferase family protein n=1 Tax=Sedimentibacter hydroxybenzoicus DSM 7310 TaxID=1123245 RepID=A0A974GV22_SEDHY|nr:polysaccharide pyruvyl transferase family protein [Sedimentibacter hydroxybenzoicus]NYB72640.1 polysaccharide pyruvyl transferase family protein [Sedimentibacter hydroxybenzoicus DSM 7310]
MEKIKALHVASFNGNIGDNANHNGFRKRLIETLGREIDFTNIEMREFYKSWNLRDFNSDDFIDLCNNHDLVVIGGGNFFELKWDYSHTGTTINIKEETLNLIKTPILFHGVGCDIAKGASQNSIEKFRLFMERITGDKNILVSVRNDGSYETIQKLYGNLFDNKFYRVPDGAFFMDSKKYDFPEIKNDYKSIGINVVADMKEIRFNSEVKGFISYENFINGFAEELNELLKKHENYQILLFPHIYSDLSAIYDLLEKIEDKYRRTRVVVSPCLTGKGSEEYIFGLYKECDFIMGMRFHSNVCAVAQNIPTIGLCSYKKILDLYREIDLNDRVIEVNKYGFKSLLREEIENTIINLEKIRNDYKRVNSNIFKESIEFYDAVKNWYITN